MPPFVHTEPLTSCLSEKHPPIFFLLWSQQNYGGGHRFEAKYPLSMILLAASRVEQIGKSFRLALSNLRFIITVIVIQCNVIVTLLFIYSDINIIFTFTK